MSTKTIKAGLSKANVNAIAGAIGTATLNRLVPQFSTSVAYTKGEYTNYNNVLYRFTADKSAGAWDNTKVETASLNDLIDDVNEAVASVVGKANTQDLLNGTLVPAKALTAEQIENVGEDVGSTQNAPFIFQATATDNGADSVETAPVAKHLKKLGNSVVINQLNNNDGTTGDNAGITYTKNDDKSWTLSGTASALSYRTIHTNISFINGHKYLLFTTKSNTNVGFYVYNSQQGVYPLAPTYGNSFVFTSSYSLNVNLVFIVKDATNLTTPLTTKVYLIDLTQWFGSNSAIPQDLLDHPENAGRYGMLGLAYNTGTLTNNNGRYLKCVGRQQWDEETESGYIRSSDGVKVNDSSKIRMKNPIRVIPNTTYYYKTPVAFYICCYDENMNFIKSVGGSTNATFTTPSNCVFIQAGFESAYGTTYNHDITISIYYEDGTGYSDYYPYEENTYDTGTEVLRSAGNAKDVKLPSNEITRNVGSVDLSTLSWTYNSSYGFYTSTGIASLIKAPASTDVKPNVIAEKYNVKKQDGESNTNDLLVVSSGNIWVKVDNSSSPTPTGMLYYELATPTTETGTSFPENIEVDNYGSMGWLDTSENYVDIPQGSEFFYPADYVEFIDSLYTRSKDGGDSADVSNIVVKSELAEYVKQVDLSDQITDVAGLSYEIKRARKTGNLCVVSIRATNSTGSAIAPSTTLFNVPTSMSIGSTYMIGYGGLSIGGETKVVLYGGNVYLEKELKSTESLTFTLTYLI